MIRLQGIVVDQECHHALVSNVWMNGYDLKKHPEQLSRLTFHQGYYLHDPSSEDRIPPVRVKWQENVTL